MSAMDIHSSNQRQAILQLASSPIHFLCQPLNTFKPSLQAQRRLLYLPRAIIRIPERISVSTPIVDRHMAPKRKQNSSTGPHKKSKHAPSETTEKASSTDSEPKRSSCQSCKDGKRACHSPLPGRLRCERCAQLSKKCVWPFIYRGNRNATVSARQTFSKFPDLEDRLKRLASCRRNLSTGVDVAPTLDLIMLAARHQAVGEPLKPAVRHEIRMHLHTLALAGSTLQRLLNLTKPAIDNVASDDEDETESQTGDVETEAATETSSSPLNAAVSMPCRSLRIRSKVPAAEVNMAPTSAAFGSIDAITFASIPSPFPNPMQTANAGTPDITSNIGIWNNVNNGNGSSNAEDVMAWGAQLATWFGSNSDPARSWLLAPDQLQLDANSSFSGDPLSAPLFDQSAMGLGFGELGNGAGGAWETAAPGMQGLDSSFQI
jgi:hypothetical protein